MKVGDVRSFRPMIDGALGETVEGTVVYIHPKRRYYTLEYTGRNGARLRESFPIQYRRGNGAERERKRP